MIYGKTSAELLGIKNDFFDNNPKMISDGRKLRGTMNSKER